MWYASFFLMVAFWAWICFNYLPVKLFFHIWTFFLLLTCVNKFLCPLCHLLIFLLIPVTLVLIFLESSNGVDSIFQVLLLFLKHLSLTDHCPQPCLSGLILGLHTDSFCYLYFLISWVSVWNLWTLILFYPGNSRFVSLSFWCLQLLIICFIIVIRWLVISSLNLPSKL